MNFHLKMLQNQRWQIEYVKHYVSTKEIISHALKKICGCSNTETFVYIKKIRDEIQLDLGCNKK